MYRAARTAPRRPRQVPLSRSIGATPTNVATCWCVNRPLAGHTVQQVFLATTERAGAGTGAVGWQARKDHSRRASTGQPYSRRRGWLGHTKPPRGGVGFPLTGVGTGEAVKAQHVAPVPPQCGGAIGSHSPAQREVFRVGTRFIAPSRSSFPRRREGGFTLEVQPSLPEHFRGRPVIQALAGRIIVQLHHLRKPTRRDGNQVGIAGQPTAPAPDSVLHPAFLPGRMGFTEERLDAEGVELVMAGELSAVVEGDDLAPGRGLWPSGWPLGLGAGPPAASGSGVHGRSAPLARRYGTASNRLPNGRGSDGRWRWGAVPPGAAGGRCGWRHCRPGGHASRGATWHGGGSAARREPASCAWSGRR